ncbi:UNVERIFIED_CONTAM: Retrovirus-related Pol polyprotein from transposon TNT 1-94 [Sesamum angustifolium]|uniref:Retrovirus-related Pol polyprotein from transposon TNT 1-94 n=1 Tax=Sesamum angustifolium TaxID=2727405 RepID=A0AAW2LVL1_9LAMI
MLDPLPDIEKTFSMVYAVEEQRAIQTDLEANSSHLALNADGKPGNKFVQQKKLFIDKKNLVCTNCHKKGHARDTCFRLHGVPDWYKSLGDRNKKGKAFTATVDAHNEELTKNSSQNVVEIVAEVMKMMQKTTMPSDPLTNYANYAQFDGEFAGATNHVCGNIALFNSYAEPTHSHYVHLPDGSKGHASAEAIKHIQNFDCKDGVSDKPCDTCHRAKQSRLSFPVSLSHSDENFDLVHMDLWGPYTANSISGCTYVLTLVDDHSRSMWTFLLKQKNQVSSILRNFCSLVRNQFDRGIKVLRSDNGTEFINHECQALCNNLGIIHQTSCTYTPQQNGRVERKHRHLLNVARALMFQASLPIKFWGDAILTATYLINRTPTKVLNWQTPFEMLYGRPPQYGHLRTFGSLCYATDITPHKAKFHSRALKCILIGYALHHTNSFIIWRCGVL